LLTGALCGCMKYFAGVHRLDTPGCDNIKAGSGIGR
jgi:hypothetical protein